MHNSINIKHGNYYYYVCFANSESAFNHTLFLGVNFTIITTSSR